MDPLLIRAAICLGLAGTVLLIERAYHRHEVRKANADKLRESMVIRRVRRAF